MSVSTFDSRDQRWKQSWVDDQGNYFDLVGEFSNNEMVLVHEQPIGDGQILNRMRFFNIQADVLDWSWARSEDAGANWKVVWEIHYERMK